MKVRNHTGAVLYQVLIFGALALLMLGGFIAWSSSNIRFGKNFHSREQTIAVAEAGIEYYRWHLAHDPVDYQDGSGTPGIYTHPYRDAAGNEIGRFELTITPPLLGSTIVKVHSAGFLDDAPGIIRKVEAVLAKPSLAKYAVAANADIRFGTGTEIFGPVHSNGGIRFDGLIHNLITSAQSQYNDPDHSGGDEYGVHTHVNPVDPLPPAAVPDRTDVFEVGRQFPVPAIDFAGFTADFANIKTQAQSGGLYLPNSGSVGYHLVLKTDDTIDVYAVTATTPPPTAGCNNNFNEDGWGTWSILTEALQETQPIPSNGAVFVEDNAWVSGAIDGARITIVSARFPEDPATDTSITVNDDLTYTHTDGTDVISLMAQKNLNVGLVSDTDLRIDAALVAKNGRVGRHHYRAPSGDSNRCSPYHNRNSITLYGMIGTNKRYGFAWTDGTGYTTRNINYDPNLLYGPPPFFPITSEQYEMLTWEEVQ